MKAKLPEIPIKAAPLYLLFLLCACLQNAGAVTIDQTGVPGALVADDTSQLNLPGTPLPDYTFPWSTNFFAYTFSPDDPGLFNLGLTSGSFLMTGNTYFNFNGDPQLSVIELSSGSPQVNINSTATPEPVSLGLLTIGLVLLLAGGATRLGKKVTG
jgi:hypothetical protein